jgi:hypothetical protein
MPLKKAVRSKTSARAKRSSRVNAKGGMVGAVVMVMALMSVAVVAVLMAARESSDAPQIMADAQLQMPAEKTGAKKVAASRPAADVLAATPTTGVIAADDPDMESGPASTARKSPVTIAGCLERTDKAYRLKDTTGADAPKARSWKSGFLKKGTAAIDLVESGNGLKLRDHIGKRVSVTGMLSDRQLRVQSVRRVASSCN